MDNGGNTTWPQKTDHKGTVDTLIGKSSLDERMDMLGTLNAEIESKGGLQYLSSLQRYAFIKLLTYSDVLARAPPLLIALPDTINARLVAVSSNIPQENGQYQFSQIAIAIFGGMVENGNFAAFCEYVQNENYQSLPGAANILLVDSPFLADEAVAGLYRMASFLSLFGIDVKVIDKPQAHGFNPSFSFYPHIIGKRFLTATLQDDVDINYQLEKQFPDSIFIAGGHEASISGRVFKVSPRLDAAVMGWGEFTLLDIAMNISCCDDFVTKEQRISAFENIRGIRINGQEIPGDNPSKLSFRVITQAYNPRLLQLCPNPIEVVNVHGASHCKQKCTFCMADAFFAGSLRQRQPVLTIEPYDFVVLARRIRKYLPLVSAINFTDDNFLVSRENLEKWLDAIEQEGLHKHFSFFIDTRLDSLDNIPITALKRMAKLNFVRIYVGIESPHEKILRDLEKGEGAYKRIAYYQDILLKAKKNGISIIAIFMILQTPQETVDETIVTIEHVINLISDCDITAALSHGLTVFPGTTLWSLYEQGRIRVNYQTINARDPRGRAITIPFRALPVDGEALRIFEYINAAAFQLSHKFYEDSSVYERMLDAVRMHAPNAIIRINLEAALLTFYRLHFTLFSIAELFFERREAVLKQLDRMIVKRDEWFARQMSVPSSVPLDNGGASISLTRETKFVNVPKRIFAELFKYATIASQQPIIIFDGIPGSGKSTLAEQFRDYLIAQGKKPLLIIADHSLKYRPARMPFLLFIVLMLPQIILMLFLTHIPMLSRDLLFNIIFRLLFDINKVKEIGLISKDPDVDIVIIEGTFSHVMLRYFETATAIFVEREMSLVRQDFINRAKTDLKQSRISAYLRMRALTPGRLFMLFKRRKYLFDAILNVDNRNNPCLLLRSCNPLDNGGSQRVVVPKIIHGIQAAYHAGQEFKRQSILIKFRNEAQPVNMWVERDLWDAMSQRDRELFERIVTTDRLGLQQLIDTSRGNIKAYMSGDSDDYYGVRTCYLQLQEPALGTKAIRFDGIAPECRSSRSVDSSRLLYKELASDSEGMFFVTGPRNFPDGPSLALDSSTQLQVGNVLYNLGIGRDKVAGQGRYINLRYHGTTLGFTVSRLAARDIRLDVLADKLIARPYDGNGDKAVMFDQTNEESLLFKIGEMLCQAHNCGFYGLRPGLSDVGIERSLHDIKPTLCVFRSADLRIRQLKDNVSCCASLRLLDIGYFLQFLGMERLTYESATKLSAGYVTTNLNRLLLPFMQGYLSIIAPHYIHLIPGANKKTKLFSAYLRLMETLEVIARTIFGEDPQKHIDWYMGMVVKREGKDSKLYGSSSLDNGGNDEKLSALGLTPTNIYDSPVLKDRIVVCRNNAPGKPQGQIIISMRSLEDLTMEEKDVVIEEFGDSWQGISYPSLMHELTLQDIVSVIKDQTYRRKIEKGAFWKPYLAISKGNASFDSEWCVEGVIETLEFAESAEIICWEIRPDNRRGRESRLIGVGLQMMFYVLNLLTHKYPQNVNISLVGLFAIRALARQGIDLYGPLARDYYLPHIERFSQRTFAWLQQTLAVNPEIVVFSDNQPESFDNGGKNEKQDPLVQHEIQMAQTKNRIEFLLRELIQEITQLRASGLDDIEIEEITANIYSLIENSRIIVRNRSVFDNFIIKVQDDMLWVCREALDEWSDRECKAWLLHEMIHLLSQEAQRLQFVFNQHKNALGNLRQEAHARGEESARRYSDTACAIEYRRSLNDFMYVNVKAEARAYRAGISYLQAMGVTDLRNYWLCLKEQAMLSGIKETYRDLLRFLNSDGAIDEKALHTSLAESTTIRQYGDLAFHRMVLFFELFGYVGNWETRAEYDDAFWNWINSYKPTAVEVRISSSSLDNGGERTFPHHLRQECLIATEEDLREYLRPIGRTVEAWQRLAALSGVVEEKGMVYRGMRLALSALEALHVKRQDMCALGAFLEKIDASPLPYHALGYAFFPWYQSEHPLKPRKDFYSVIIKMDESLGNFHFYNEEIRTSQHVPAQAIVAFYIFNHHKGVFEIIEGESLDNGGKVYPVSGQTEKPLRYQLAITSAGMKRAAQIYNNIQGAFERFNELAMAFSVLESWLAETGKNKGPPQESDLIDNGWGEKVDRGSVIAYRDEENHKIRKNICDGSIYRLLRRTRFDHDFIINCINIYEAYLDEEAAFLALLEFMRLVPIEPVNYNRKDLLSVPQAIEYANTLLEKYPHAEIIDAKDREEYDFLRKHQPTIAIIHEMFELAKLSDNEVRGQRLAQWYEQHWYKSYLNEFWADAFLYHNGINTRGVLACSHFGVYLYPQEEQWHLQRLPTEKLWQCPSYEDGVQNHPASVVLIHGGLELEGYSIRIMRTSEYKWRVKQPRGFECAFNYTLIFADIVDAAGRVLNKHGNIRIHIYPRWHLIYVSRFYPEFPDKTSAEYREGRGRSLLRALIGQYQGYEVVVWDASFLFQKSLHKMEDFHPVTRMHDTEALKRIIREKAQLHPDDKTWRGYWTSTSFYGVVPGEVSLDNGGEKRTAEAAFGQAFPIYEGTVSAQGIRRSNGAFKRLLSDNPKARELSMSIVHTSKLENKISSLEIITPLEIETRLIDGEIYSYAVARTRNTYNRLDKRFLAIFRGDASKDETIRQEKIAALYIEVEKNIFVKLEEEDHPQLNRALRHTLSRVPLSYVTDIVLKLPSRKRQWSKAVEGVSARTISSRELELKRGIHRERIKVPGDTRYNYFGLESNAGTIVRFEHDIDFVVCLDTVGKQFRTPLCSLKRVDKDKIEFICEEETRVILIKKNIDKNGYFIDLKNGVSVFINPRFRETWKVAVWFNAGPYLAIMRGGYFCGIKNAVVSGLSRRIAYYLRRTMTRKPILSWVITLANHLKADISFADKVVSRVDSATRWLESGACYYEHTGSMHLFSDNRHELTELIGHEITHAILRKISPRALARCMDYFMLKRGDNGELFKFLKNKYVRKNKDKNVEAIGEIIAHLIGFIISAKREILIGGRVKKPGSVKYVRFSGPMLSDDIEQLVTLELLPYWMSPRYLGHTNAEISSDYYRLVKKESSRHRMDKIKLKRLTSVIGALRAEDAIEIKRVRVIDSRNRVCDVSRKVLTIDVSLLLDQDLDPAARGFIFNAEKSLDNGGELRAPLNDDIAQLDMLRIEMLSEEQLWDICRDEIPEAVAAFNSGQARDAESGALVTVNAFLFQSFDEIAQAMRIMKQRNPVVKYVYMLGVYEKSEMSKNIFQGNKDDDNHNLYYVRDAVTGKVISVVQDFSPGAPHLSGSFFSLIDHAQPSARLGGHQGYRRLAECLRKEGLIFIPDLIINTTGIDCIWLNDESLQTGEGYWYVYRDISDEEQTRLARFDSVRNLPHKSDVPAWSRQHCRLVEAFDDIISRNPGFFLHYSAKLSRWILVSHFTEYSMRQRGEYCSDVALLDLSNPHVRQAIIDMAVAYAKITGGFRCDCAMASVKQGRPAQGEGGFLDTWQDLPTLYIRNHPGSWQQEFWRELISHVRQVNPEAFFLGEAYWLIDVLTACGFNCFSQNLAKDSLDRNDHGYSNVGNLQAYLQREPFEEYRRRAFSFVSHDDEPGYIARDHQRRPQFTFSRLRNALITIATMPGIPIFMYEHIQGFLVRGSAKWCAIQQQASYQQAQRGMESVVSLASDPVFSRGSLYVINTGLNHMLAYARSYQHRHTLVVANHCDYQKECIIPLSGCARELGLSAQPHRYYALTDRLTGNVFLRSGRELIEYGLYVNLEGSSSHVFMVQELALLNGSYKHLCEMRQRNNGRGLNIEDIFVLMQHSGFVLDFPCHGPVAKARVSKLLIDNRPIEGANAVLRGDKMPSGAVTFVWDSAAVRTEIVSIQERYPDSEPLQRACKVLTVVSRFFRKSLKDVTLHFTVNREETSFRISNDRKHAFLTLGVPQVWGVGTAEGAQRLEGMLRDVSWIYSDGFSAMLSGRSPPSVHSVMEFISNLYTLFDPEIYPPIRAYVESLTAMQLSQPIYHFSLDKCYTFFKEAVLLFYFYGDNELVISLITQVLPLCRRIEQESFVGRVFSFLDNSLERVMLDFLIQESSDQRLVSLQSYIVEWAAILGSPQTIEFLRTYVGNALRQSCEHRQQVLPDVPGGSLGRAATKEISREVLLTAAGTLADHGMVEIVFDVAANLFEPQEVRRKYVPGSLAAMLLSKSGIEQSLLERIAGKIFDPDCFKKIAAIDALTLAVINCKDNDRQRNLARALTENVHRFAKNPSSYFPLFYAWKAVKKLDEMDPGLSDRACCRSLAKAIFNRQQQPWLVSKSFPAGSYSGIEELFLSERLAAGEIIEKICQTLREVVSSTADLREAITFSQGTHLFLEQLFICVEGLYDEKRETQDRRNVLCAVRIAEYRERCRLAALQGGNDGQMLAYLEASEDGLIAAMVDKSEHRRADIIAALGYDYEWPALVTPSKEKRIALFRRFLYGRDPSALFPSAEVTLAAIDSLRNLGALDDQATAGQVRSTLHILLYTSWHVSLLLPVGHATVIEHMSRSIDAGLRLSAETLELLRSIQKRYSRLQRYFEESALAFAIDKILAAHQLHNDADKSPDSLDNGGNPDLSVSRTSSAPRVESDLQFSKRAQLLSRGARKLERIKHMIQKLGETLRVRSLILDYDLLGVYHDLHITPADIDIFHNPDMVTLELPRHWSNVNNIFWRDILAYYEGNVPSFGVHGVNVMGELRDARNRLFHSRSMLDPLEIQYASLNFTANDTIGLWRLGGSQEDAKTVEEILYTLPTDLQKEFFRRGLLHVAPANNPYGLKPFMIFKEPDISIRTLLSRLQELLKDELDKYDFTMGMRDEYVISFLIAPVLMAVLDIVEVEESIKQISRAIERANVNDKNVRVLHIGGMNHNNILQLLLESYRCVRIRISQHYEGRMMVQLDEMIAPDFLFADLTGIVDHIIVDNGEVKVDCEFFYRYLSEILHNNPEYFKRQLLMSAIWRPDENLAQRRPAEVKTTEPLDKSLIQFVLCHHRDRYFCSKLSIAQLEELRRRLSIIGYPQARCRVFVTAHEVLSGISIEHDVGVYAKLLKFDKELEASDPYLRRHNERIRAFDDDVKLKWIPPHSIARSTLDNGGVKDTRYKMDQADIIFSHDIKEIWRIDNGLSCKKYIAAGVWFYSKEVPIGNTWVLILPQASSMSSCDLHSVFEDQFLAEEFAARAYLGGLAITNAAGFSPQLLHRCFILSPDEYRDYVRCGKKEPNPLMPRIFERLGLSFIGSKFLLPDEGSLLEGIIEKLFRIQHDAIGAYFQGGNMFMYADAFRESIASRWQELFYQRRVEKLLGSGAWKEIRPTIKVPRAKTLIRATQEAAVITYQDWSNAPLSLDNGGGNGEEAFPNEWRSLLPCNKLQKVTSWSDLQGVDLAWLEQLEIFARYACLCNNGVRRVKDYFDLSDGKECLKALCLLDRHFKFSKRILPIDASETFSLIAARENSRLLFDFWMKYLRQPAYSSDRWMTVEQWIGNLLNPTSQESFFIREPYCAISERYFYYAICDRQIKFVKCCAVSWEKSPAPTRYIVKGHTVRPDAYYGLGIVMDTQTGMLYRYLKNEIGRSSLLLALMNRHYQGGWQQFLFDHLPGVSTMLSKDRSSLDNGGVRDPTSTTGVNEEQREEINRRILAQRNNACVLTVLQQSLKKDYHIILDRAEPADIQRDMTQESLPYPQGVNIAINALPIPGFELAGILADPSREHPISIRGVNFLYFFPQDSLFSGKHHPDMAFIDHAVFVKDEKIMYGYFPKPLRLDGSVKTLLSPMYRNKDFFEAHTIPVLNPMYAHKMCEDKYELTRALKKAGVCVPEGILLARNKDVLTQIRDFAFTRSIAQVVIKPRRASLGFGVRMFSAVQLEEAAQHAKHLRNYGHDVLVEERIESSPWFMGNTRFDFNFRVLATWNEDEPIFDFNMIEVRYGPYGRGPINKSQGATVLSLQDFFIVQRNCSTTPLYTLAQREERFKLMREYTIMSMKCVAEACGVKPGLIGWDIIWGDRKDTQVCCIEGNTGMVGGIGTLENMHDPAKKGKTIMYVLQHIVQQAQRYRASSSETVTDELGEPIRGCNSTATLNTIGGIYYACADHARAQTSWEKSLQINPRQLHLWRNLALIASQQNKDVTEIADLYLSAIEYGGRFPQTLLPLAYILRDIDPASAQSLYREAIALDDSCERAYAELGMMLAAYERYEEALPYLKRALMDSSDHFLVLLHLSIVYMAQGRFLDAQETSERAWQGQLLHSRLPLRHLKSLIKQDRTDEALELCKNLDALEPSNEARTLMRYLIMWQKNGGRG
ncbi:MAG: radical SAM protein [Candidatus Omnitrophica bacterium]|nr:radical SAM protein [Candidatus Omnitrophota bacterium]